MIAQERPIPSTVITVLNGHVQLMQADKGFRTCFDSIMLGAACPARAGGTILDLGCGVGGAGFCALYRVENAKLMGLEIQEDHVTIAEKNAALNNMDTRAEFIPADIRTYKTERNFNHVICNPPYMKDGTHLQSPYPAKATAHGGDTTIKDWVDCGYRCLKPGGSFTMIHRADQTDRIIHAFDGRFGAVDIIPLWPKDGVLAKRVIVRALKDRKSPATIHNGLIIHKTDGTYTNAANRILKEGHGLCL